MQNETAEEPKTDREQQTDDQMWDCYVEQQQRLGCPACGESEEMY